MELAEFLLARIAEDEELAQNLLRWGKHSNYYQQPGFGFDRWAVRRHEESMLIEAHGGIFRPQLVLSLSYLDGDMADHIARHDPARVLAECEAKRRIVAECLTDENVVFSARFSDSVLELLALPYASHPDYRSEWAP